MRRLLLALLAIAVLAAGAGAVALGVGPFARGAPPSVVYVAISRSTDEADAREIEAIDLAAGTRELFDAGGRITALATSSDRRSLYVAVDAGRIVFLDATTGTHFAEVDLRGPVIAALVALPDGKTLYALAVTGPQSSLVPVDLETRKVGDAIALPPGAGSMVLRGDVMLVPVADVRGTQVLFVSLRTRSVTDRLTLPRGSTAPPLALGLSDSKTAIISFDPTGAGGGTIRVYLVENVTHWDVVTLAAPFGIGPGRGGQAQMFAAASTTGFVHVCVPAAGGARRYVAGPDLRSAVAGAECGPLAGGSTVLLARRDPAQLLVLDPTTGSVTRTLPLAGVPARLIR